MWNEFCNYVSEMHIHLHIHNDKSVDEKLNTIINKLNVMAEKNQEYFETVLTELDTLSNDIAEDYAKLLAAASDNITPEQKARAEARIAQLKALASSVDNPVPEPIPTEPIG